MYQRLNYIWTEQTNQINVKFRLISFNLTLSVEEDLLEIRTLFSLYSYHCSQLYEIL